MFGVSVSQQNQGDDHYHREMTKVLEELMQAAVYADPKGDFANFTKRKAISVQTPFEEEDLYTYLK